MGTGPYLALECVREGWWELLGVGGPKVPLWCSGPALLPRGPGQTLWGPPFSLPLTGRSWANMLTSLSVHSTVCEMGSGQPRLMASCAAEMRRCLPCVAWDVRSVLGQCQHRGLGELQAEQVGWRACPRFGSWPLLGCRMQSDIHKGTKRMTQSELTRGEEVLVSLPCAHGGLADQPGAGVLAVGSMTCRRELPVWVLEE